MGRRTKQGDAKVKVHGHGQEEEEEEYRPPTQDQEDQDQRAFFACYLLCSLCPRYKSRTYIGFTVNPRRRIRQHNGEIMCGAGRTKKGRPWEMVLCIYGFPSNITALQFEWAWQHPTESIVVRKAASHFKSLRGLANKIKLAYTMLSLPSWENLNLTVNFFSTKYTKFMAGCPKLPSQMKSRICLMDDLPCYSKDYFSNRNNELADQVQQTAFASMEEMFSSDRCSDGGSSDNNHHCNQSEVDNTYERLQELDSASMDYRVKDQSKEDNKAKSDEIASPEGFNEAVSSDTGGGIVSPGNDVIDLVTPLSCIAKRRGKRIMSSMIDLTSSPCIIEL